MKIVKLLLIISIFSTYVFAEDGLMKTNAQELLEFKAGEHQRRKDQYEEEFGSGLITLALGTIGYYSSDNIALKQVYSLVQTLGITTAGAAWYDQNTYSMEETFLKMMKSEKLEKEQMSFFFLETLAKRDEAKRESMLLTSSILTVQYAANAFIGSPDEDLKKIYTFLGSVTLMAGTYSYFYRSDYEKLYGRLKKKHISFSLLPNYIGVTHRF